MFPSEKLLPNQPFNSSQYQGAVSVEQAIYQTILRTCSIQEPAVKFKLEESPLFSVEQMASSAVVLGFMQWLIKLTKAKRVLEVGTFIGVSALYFAEALPADGQIVTIEKFDRFAEIAERNFASNGYSSKIELKLGGAQTILPFLSYRTTFDIAFIDGAKENYAEYFGMIEPIMNSGGVIVVDDAFFHGDALNVKPVSEKGNGVRTMLDLSESLTDWQRILLPISNGVLLMIKP